MNKKITDSRKIKRLTGSVVETSRELSLVGWAIATDPCMIMVRDGEYALIKADGSVEVVS